MPCSRKPPARPPKRPAATVAAACVALSFLAGTAQAQTSQPDNKQPVAQQVMTELKAAGKARGQLLKEQQQWALDKEKLELLKSTVMRETQRHRAAATKARQTETELRRRLEQHEVAQQRLKSVEGVVDALCERLEKALTALASKSLPGLVPPDRAASITDPGRRLAAGVDRLRQVRRRAKQAAVEIVSGSLEKQTIAVKMLRVGGVAAWWLSLDGKQAGTATVRDGKMILTHVTKLEDVRAIQSAFAIAEGRGTPNWALLPVQTKATKD